MGSFAPAPWQIIPYVDGIDIVDANGQLVARVADRNVCGDGLPPANARLIKVAPELLAACEAWDEGFIDGEEFTPEQFRVWVNERRRMARAAISKAKGTPLCR